MVKRKRAVAAAALVLSTMVLAGWSAANASAHLVYEQRTWLSGPVVCAGMGSGIAGLGGEGGSGGQVMVDNWTQAYVPFWPHCLTATNRDAGTIFLGRHLYFYDYDCPCWRVGPWSGWLTNEGATSYFSISRQWDNMPNGARWYNNLGHTYLWMGSHWEYGYNFSGNHWLW